MYRGRKEQEMYILDNIHIVVCGMAVSQGHGLLLDINLKSCTGAQEGSAYYSEMRAAPVHMLIKCQHKLISTSCIMPLILEKLLLSDIVNNMLEGKEKGKQS